MTYTLIAHTEVGSGGTSGIVFSSIPQTFTDLLCVTSLRYNDNSVNGSAFIKLNGVTTNFSRRNLQGSGSSTTSGNASDSFIGNANGTTSTANTFGSLSLYIPNYRTSSNKSYSTDSVGENNATTIYQDLVAGLWSNSAAITSLEIYGFSNILQYSSATLYGITAGSTPGVVVS